MWQIVSLIAKKLLERQLSKSKIGSFGSSFINWDNKQQPQNQTLGESYEPRTGPMDQSNSLPNLLSNQQPQMGEMDSRTGPLNQYDSFPTLLSNQQLGGGSIWGMPNNQTPEDEDLYHSLFRALMGRY